MTGLRIHILVAVISFTVCRSPMPCHAYITVPKEPIPNKAALADCIVVGKIVKLHEKEVEARLYHHGDVRVAFVVVDVEVTEPLYGAKEVKQVAFAFIGFQVKAAAKPAVGQEGIFFGVKNSEKNFFVVPQGGFHERKSENYAKDLALARRCARALNEPDKALEVKDTDDRVLAAYIWSLRYTYTPMRWGGELKPQPVDADRSKRIVLALADADWTKPDATTGASPHSALGWLQQGATRSGSPFKDVADLPTRQQGEPPRQSSNGCG